MWQAMQRFSQAIVCKQRQLLIRSFPLSMHFSSWCVNKTSTTDFKTCRKQCTPRLINACSGLSNCRNHCARGVSKKLTSFTAKCQCFHWPTWCKRKMQGVDWKNVCVRVLDVVSTQCKRKTHVNGLKKCLFVRINFHVVEPRTSLMLWKI